MTASMKRLVLWSVPAAVLVVVLAVLFRPRAELVDVVQVQMAPMLVTIDEEGIKVEGLDNATFELLDCDADTVISVSDSPFFMPENDGNYAIIVTTVACRDTTPCLNYIATSAEEVLSEDLFRLFPNPTNDRITIEVEGDLIGRYEMQIFDMRGKQYMRQSIQLLPNHGYNYP